MTWAVVAAIQLAVVVWAATRLHKTARVHWATGVVLVAVGAIIVAADVAWIVTGGPDGRSSIGMRGGWFGLWLSLLTAGECLAVGLLILALTLSRRRRTAAL